MNAIPPPLNPTASRVRWGIHLILITSYILAVGLLGWGRSETHSVALSRSATGLLSACALELVVFGFIFGLACFASRATRDDLLLRWQGNIRPILLGAGYSVALRFAVALVAIAIGIGLVASHIMTPDSLKSFFSNNRPNVEAMVDLAALSHDPMYFWLTLTLVSFIVAGLREELWRSAFLAGMRTLWPKSFCSRNGQVLAVLICAIFFGIAHMAMGPIAVFMAGLIGIGLGLIMIYHGSIWPAVIAHGFFDATTLAMLPWIKAHMT